MLLQRFHDRVEETHTYWWYGRVVRASQQLIESVGPVCSVGESCEVIDRRGRRYAGEVVGFHNDRVMTMLVDASDGIRLGDSVVTKRERPSLRVGDCLLGRVIDAEGQPMDGTPLNGTTRIVPLDSLGPDAMTRVPISQTMGSGVRAIDALLTCGRGQRIGIFGGSGVGKSTLMGMMARGTEADITVVALVGERGREVREFLEDSLGAEGRKRSVVVVSTSDQSPLRRLRAALAATAVAEHFACEGKNVLLVVDSLTRFAMAQREIGLAAGEPPTSKGYTPSVFSMLAQLVERAGITQRGSITAYYTVLMEGDDQMDPIVDSVRSLLDGHIILDRNLTSAGQYPPINVLESLSRLMPAVCTREHLAKANRLRQLLSAYSRSQDLIRIGAYVKGYDGDLDRAIELMPQIQAFLRQAASERAGIADTIQRLQALPS